jgi:hypothetical protein
MNRSAIVGPNISITIRVNFYTEGCKLSAVAHRRLEPFSRFAHRRLEPFSRCSPKVGTFQPLITEGWKRMKADLLTEGCKLSAVAQKK